MIEAYITYLSIEGFSVGFLIAAYLLAVASWGPVVGALVWGTFKTIARDYEEVGACRTFRIPTDSVRHSLDTRSNFLLGQARVDRKPTCLPPPPPGCLMKPQTIWE